MLISCLKHPFVDDDDTKEINCSDWSCNQRGYMEWWYDKLPHFECLNPENNKLNNWWHYEVDYDDAIAHEAELAAQGCELRTQR